MAKGVLAVFANGGLGDFIRCWRRLRVQGKCTVLTRDDRHSRLAAVMLSNLQSLSSAGWQEFLLAKRSPPETLNEYDELQLYYHDTVLDDHKISTMEQFANSVNQSVTLVRCPFFAKPTYFGEDSRPLERECETVLFHAGAGYLNLRKALQHAPLKAWPLHTSLEFVQKAREASIDVRLIAGGDQASQWTGAEMAKFTLADGVIVDDLFELACRIRGCGLFVGFDSGPSHLAAQLGRECVVLVGPTGPNPLSSVVERIDMVDCLPIGPRVEVVCPPEGTPDSDKSQMKWLTPSGLLARLQARLAIKRT